MDTDPEAEPLRLPTVLGVPIVEKAARRLWFQLAGQQVQLQALDGGDGELFVIFADATNDDTTYGAGRFLWVKGVDASGHTTIDFNRAYNPPCAFTPFAPVHCYHLETGSIWPYCRREEVAWWGPLSPPICRSSPKDPDFVI